MKLPLDMSSTDLHPVSADHRDTLASTADWEVVGAVVFEGRVDFLVFVQRRYFYQITDEVFERCDFKVPAHWRIVTRVDNKLEGVSLLMGHPLITSEPTLAGELVDMDPDALAKLRSALEQDQHGALPG